MAEHIFRVLMVWLDGQEYVRDPLAEEEVTAGKFKVLADAATRRRHRSFLLLAERNWRIELAKRNIKLPPQLAGIVDMPEKMAVDRLLGVQDGKRWRPGIAGLQPAEAHVIRRKVLDRWPTWEVCQEMHITPSSARVYLYEARRKLRACLRAEMTVTLPGDQAMVAQP